MSAEFDKDCPRCAELEHKLADALKQYERVKVERNGAIDRAQLCLDAKNNWADRARAAEARVSAERDTDLAPGVLDRWETWAASLWAATGSNEAAFLHQEIKLRRAQSATAPLQWIPVSERLPEGVRGVSYMTYTTDVVLVLHKDRPDYPLTAHASLGDDLDTLGVRIPTNGASKYKWISWFSAGRDGSNPFDLAGLRDSAGYERKLPRYLGSGITHWMPLPNVPTAERTGEPT